jgi:pyridoxine 4-dehydrogenase
MPTSPGGTLTLAEDLTLSRLGYGAMQLAGPGVFGPPKDRDGAIAVLREAVALGITHSDTSDYYGPTVVNEIIKDAPWIMTLDPDDLKAQVRENLQHLGLDVLDVVNLRVGSAEGTVEGSKERDLLHEATRELC